MNATVDLAALKGRQQAAWRAATTRSSARRCSTAARNGRAERLDVTFEVADAEALPFADARFDAVLSTFGVMLAPDQVRAAAELARVCRPGGRIVLPTGRPAASSGRCSRRWQAAAHRGRAAAVARGVEAHLHALFGDAATQSP